MDTNLEKLYSCPRGVSFVGYKITA